MARTSKPTPEVLEEFESAADRMATWVAQNWRIVVPAIALVLFLAGAIAAYDARRTRNEERAASALALVRAEYLAALGADPNAVDVPELANPRAAERIRDDYRDRFRAVAEQHPGTVAATLAALELGNLQVAVDPEAAVRIWNEALAAGPSRPALRAILLRRLAQAHEDAERWVEAGEAHLAAADIQSFPLRAAALADAARCFADAAQGERALELFERLERDHPESGVPSQLRSLLRELSARGAS